MPVMLLALPPVWQMILGIVFILLIIFCSIFTGRKLADWFNEWKDAENAGQASSAQQQTQAAQNAAQQQSDNLKNIDGR